MIIRPLNIILILAFQLLTSIAVKASPDTLQYVIQGARVNGYFYASSSPDAPTFFFLPGFLDSGDRWDIGHKLSEQGINFFTIDFRGCYFSEGEYSLMNAQEDIDEGIKYLTSADIIQKYHLNPDKIILGGYSFGGGMALSYAVHHSQIKKLIAISSVDLNRFAAELKKDDYQRTMFEAILETMCFPDGPTSFQDDHPIDELIRHQEYFDVIGSSRELSNRQVLLICGKYDKTVDPFLHTIPLYQNLKEYHSKAQLKVFASDHSFAEVQDLLISAIITWIKQLE